MKTIRLYGELGKRFGREFKLDVQSPAEAVRALRVIVPGFQTDRMRLEHRVLTAKSFASRLRYRGQVPWVESFLVQH